MFLANAFGKAPALYAAPDGMIPLPRVQTEKLPTVIRTTPWHSIL